MNMKYIYVVSVLVVAMIGIGCVGKVSEETTDKKDNISSSEVSETLHNASLPKETNTSGNVSSPEAVYTPDNVSLPNDTDVQTAGTSVTKVFNIGDENSMLGVNVKLVNITDYDSNAITLLINGVEYKYDPSSGTSIRTNGIDVIDVITSADDKTAEITVDYIR